MRKATVTLTLLAVLVFPAFSQADYDPLGGGTTKVTLDKSFVSLLKKAGVTLEAKAPAKKQGKAIILPVSGGKADPTTGKAEVLTEGSLVFAKGNRSVPLRRIELKANPNPITAKVGGSQLKVAKAKTVSPKREGFGLGFQAKPLTLTQKVATRLNKKLRTKDAFKEGQLIGSLKAKTTPRLVTILPQGKGTLVPDSQILAKFKSLFVSLNPISPAELSPGPVLSFPIAAGGQISPSASEGTLRLGGAIELLQLGAGQVFHSEYWLDLGAKTTSAEVEMLPTPAFPGKLGRIGVFGIDTAAASVATDPKGRSISLANAQLTLDAATAQSFNEAFAGGAPVFVAGEAFGAVSFGALGQ